MQAFLIELWMWFAGFFVLGMFLVAWLGRIHMKSRLSRARGRLRDIISATAEPNVVPDRLAERR